MTGVEIVPFQDRQGEGGLHGTRTTREPDRADRSS